MRQPALSRGSSSSSSCSSSSEPTLSAAAAAVAAAAASAAADACFWKSSEGTSGRERLNELQPVLQQP
ncbi:hypothetical protein ETH_00024975 [Eimeria tenella]|uniref:Uncharacterized protein n=1 Tax=Eimeria tenella TaxID=5802 RepID=U6KN97_EIMTE|nr:hypothetical protein ETH_00024975 [Eimeria tenella]CDJ38311.1 hypothetical protein ETH_00024975 [Eimeria tenella]|eukprot:XP_013229149.1 hypothetical protein ETH_00024975 [Eimeria tenella]